jgi:hypothetical protein
MKKSYGTIMKVIKEKNLIPKVISLLLSLILWVHVVKEKMSEISVKFPITFNGLDDNYVISGISTKIATVKINGYKDEIKDINSRNIKLIVDLSSAEPGYYSTYPIECHKIDFTGNYEVSVDPEKVEILLEKKISRMVKVIPEFKGIVKDDLMIGRVKIIPEYIKIDGPLSIINNIGVIFTENISIDDKTETFKMDAKILKAHDDNVNYNTSRVNITVPVINHSETETVEVPVFMKNKRKGFNYLLIFDKVKIQIMKTDEENITEHSFFAYIDCDEIKIDNEEFALKSKITAMAFVYVIADTLKNESKILSSTPAGVEIVVTKE